jgi:hypothetical protein
MTIDVGVSALTRIQNEIRNHKVSLKPSEDMKVEALPGQPRAKIWRVSRLQRSRGRKDKDERKSLVSTAARKDTKKECRKFLAEQAKTDKNDTKTQGSRTNGSKDDQDKSQYSHTAASANHRPEQTRDEPRTWAVSHQAQKVTAGTGGTRTDPWCLDSAATSHITNCRDVYTSMRKIRDTVTVANSRQLLSQGLGTYLRRDGEMLMYARRVGRNYVLYPHGAHGALIRAGQDNG